MSVSQDTHKVSITGQFHLQILRYLGKTNSLAYVEY